MSLREYPKNQPEILRFECGYSKGHDCLVLGQPRGSGDLLQTPTSSASGLRSFNGIYRGINQS